MFLEWNAVQVAEQITLLDYEIFKKIGVCMRASFLGGLLLIRFQAPELQGNAWNNEKKKHIAPNVLQLINRINQLGYWVAMLVLIQPSALARQQMYRKIVVIAEVGVV